MEVKKKSRIIRIEPNPFASVKIKIKMAKAKVDVMGRPMVTKGKDGKNITSKEIVDAGGLVQFPGTRKFLKAAACRDGLLTGLNVVVPNPYADEDFYTQDWAEKKLRNSPKAMLQHILEYKHGVELNHYHNRLNSGMNKPNSTFEKPFFHSINASLPLEGNTFFLDLSIPLHEVIYYVAKANVIIANSYKDLDDGRNQDALYYIVDEQAAADVKTVKSKRTNEAIAFIEGLNKIPGELVRFSKALGIDDPISNDRLAYEALEAYFRQGGTNYSNFMFYADMYKNEINKPQFDASVALYDAIEADVVVYRSGIYTWQKPSTDATPTELIRFNSKASIISELFINPKSKEDLEVIMLLIKEYKRFN
jgi:hypothetical protein